MDSNQQVTLPLSNPMEVTADKPIKLCKMYSAPPPKYLQKELEIRAARLCVHEIEEEPEVFSFEYDSCLIFSFLMHIAFLTCCNLPTLAENPNQYKFLVQDLPPS